MVIYINNLVLNVRPLNGGKMVLFILNLTGLVINDFVLVLLTKRMMAAR